MSDAGFFRGTSSEQDNRFSDKEKKLLKQMRFSDSILKKVDMGKVKLEALKPWISKRISELLGMEDDVLVEFVFNQLEAESFPDARRIQINLTGFLNGKNARIFTGELWDMLLSAQETACGIPGSIIDSKKEEIKKRNEEQEKITETLKKTVSRFNDRLRKDRDSPPSRRDRRSTSRDKSRTRSRSKEREKNIRVAPKVSSDGDGNSSTTELKKKDDSVQAKRHYRSRHSSSASPDISKRKSRSTSPNRDSRDKRESRNKNQKDLMDEIKADRDREKDRHDVPPPRHERDRDRGVDRNREWRERDRSDWGGDRRNNRDRLKRSRSHGSRSRSPQQDRNRRRPPHYGQQPSNSRGFSAMDRDRRDFGNDHSIQRGPENFRSMSPDRPNKDNRFSSTSYADRKFSQGRSTLHSVFNSGHGSDIHKGRFSRSRSPEARKVVEPERERRSGSVSSGRTPSPYPRQSSKQPKTKHNNEKENSTISVAKDKEKDAKRIVDSSLLKRGKDKDSAHSSSAEDNGVSRKKKKKEKKHKKHKKHKKQKKAKRSESEDDDDDEEASGDEEIGSGGSRIASSFLKLVEPTAVVHSEDLEKTLREKALESMKKAAAAGRE